MKRHRSVVVSTRRLSDCFRKRYLLRCHECEEWFGPYRTIGRAWDASLDFEQLQCPWLVISEQSLA